VIYSLLYRILKQIPHIWSSLPSITGLGHASPSYPTAPDTFTDCSTHVYECWGVLWTQATPSAIPADAAPPTYGQRELSPTTVPWQGGSLHAVPPLQEGATPDADAQGQRKPS